MKRTTISERMRTADEQFGAWLGILGEEAAGAGSRADLENVAGAVKRAKARLAALETDIALRLARTEGKREAAEILQDQMGMTPYQAETHQPLPDREGKAGRGAAQLVVVADMGVTDGSRPEGRCEVLGSGPAPPSVLGQLSPDTRLSGIIFGGKGRVLWLGRSQRLGNAAQRMAAAVRDGGCVRCDISTRQNQLHHIWDWYDGGPTDIDNLASLCGTHHRRLQDGNLELFQQDGRWKTRLRPA